MERVLTLLTLPSSAPKGHHQPEIRQLASNIVRSVLVKVPKYPWLSGTWDAGGGTRAASCKRYPQAW